MKLARFDTLLEARQKMERLNNLAKNISSTEPFSLSEIYSPDDNSFFWFIYDPDCLNNSGDGRILIEQEESTMDIYEYDNIPVDWFPSCDTPIK